MAQGIGLEYRGIARIIQLPVKTSAAFKAGQFLIFNSGVDRCAASNANVGATGDTTRIAGMAMEDATTSGGTAKGIVGVMVAEPGTEFLISIYHGTPASAVADPAAQLGRAFELRNVGGSYDSVDISATTNTKMVITDYSTAEYPTWPGKLSDTAGSVTAGTVQYPYVWVSFLGSCVCFSGAGR